MSLIKRTSNSLPFLFEDLLNTDWFGGIAQTEKIGRSLPAVNIQETDDDFIVEVAVPGRSKADINIALDNELLTVSSKAKEQQEETTENKTKFTRKEFGGEVFERSFNLPKTINSAEIKANYEQGILVITLPKREEAKVQEKRLIEIL